MDNGSYVFISYAHKDADVVLPCVQAMKNAGINIWYDEGIQAGSEWPEYIAEKVISCTKFVLFISRAYLESQNCKRELNFAISRKKDLLSVFIEDVELSPGVEMQLGTYQSIFKNRFTGDDAFCQSLCNEQWFNECRNGHAAYASSTAQAQFASVQTKAEPNTMQQPVYTAPKVDPLRKNNKPKSKIVAALLAIFLGGIGIHKFYLNKPIFGIAYIVLCWTYIPSIVALIEGLILLFTPDEKFDLKYNK